MITLAGIINALKLVGKKLEEVKIVTSGAGAAGIAIIRLLISMGLLNVIMTDRKGVIYEGREGLNAIKEEMAHITNFGHEKGTLVNNVLCFPGIFRGALGIRATDINDEMKVAAAHAIASLVSDEELNADYILPAAFDPRVRDAVALAVGKAGRESGVARI